MTTPTPRPFTAHKHLDPKLLRLTIADLCDRPAEGPPLTEDEIRWAVEELKRRNKKENADA
jgi:hypothetical protein